MLLRGLIWKGEVMKIDTCIICGETIPEGRQYCWTCKWVIDNKECVRRQNERSDKRCRKTSRKRINICK